MNKHLEANFKTQKPTASEGEPEKWAGHASESERRNALGPCVSRRSWVRGRKAPRFPDRTRKNRGETPSPERSSSGPPHGFVLDSSAAGRAGQTCDALNNGQLG